MRYLKSKLTGFSPPTSCFASRVDVSQVTPTPHHGVTHGSNILVDKSRSRTLTRIQSTDPRDKSSARLPTTGRLPKPLTLTLFT